MGRRSPPSTCRCRHAHRSPTYGSLPDLAAIDPAHDLVLAWNGTTSGVRLPDGAWLRRGDGLVICDATSAAFAMALPWDRLDVVTWSWQKALGGEAAHGMLAMSPRARGAAGDASPRLAAAEDLPHHAGPVPRRHDQHALHAVRGGRAGRAALGRAQGGLPALIARSEANLAAIAAGWRDALGRVPGRRPGAPLPHLHLPARGRRARAIARLLDAEGVAFDIANYRDAPPGLRIWGGATVETADIEALLPWLDWAHAPSHGFCLRRGGAIAGRCPTAPRPAGRFAANPALLPAGLRDLLPPEAETEAAAVERVMAAFAAHGYERIKPPLIEFEDGLLAGSAAPRRTRSSA